MSARARPASADLFAPLAGETLRAIASSGVVRQFPKNTVLINEGDQGDSIYIILFGKVKVFASTAAGKEVVLDFHGAGEYVGEMSLDGAPRSASVMTIEPTACAIVNRARFREFIRAHPDFALHLIEKLIKPTRLATGNVKSLALLGCTAGLSGYWSRWHRSATGRQVIPVRLTQQEIAERVGASRDMISRLIKDLVAGGYIALEDRTITILKRLPAAW